MSLRATARAALLDRCLAAAPDDVGPPSVLCGWPGLVLLHHCIAETSPHTEPELLHLASRWRALERPEPALPPEVRGSFLYGTRGRRWAERALDGPAPRDATPPGRTLGFDTFANDGPVFFAHGHRHRAPHRAAWARFVSAELARLRHDLDAKHPVLLGFAHGVAGLLFRALLLDDPAVLDRPSLHARLEWLAAQRVVLHDAARWPVRVGQPLTNTWVASSLCNGSLGHALLFLEAAARLGDERFLEVAQQALAATADESSMGPSWCCGHAGRATVVSRLLRLGLRPRSSEAEGTLERLWARLPGELHRHALHPINGLASCLPALAAQGPASPLLDVFLPAPHPAVHPATRPATE